ncbi:MAG: hypothetical protein ACLU85_00725 [Lachnospirales bacterium]
MGYLLKICWSIEPRQKAEIADSVSLLTSWTAIFDFYLAKAKYRGKQSFSRRPGRRRGVCSYIGVSFSVVRNQEEERKNARFPRQKNIKGYAAFCCGKYLELL